MNTVKADQKRRIVLPGSEPGAVYEVDERPQGRYRLTRLVRPPESQPPSAEEVRQRLSANPLRPHYDWDELRSITREP